MADIAVNKQVLSEGAGEDYERPQVHDQVTIVMSCTTANDDEKDVALREQYKGKHEMAVEISVLSETHCTISRLVSTMRKGEVACFTLSAAAMPDLFEEGALDDPEQPVKLKMELQRMTVAVDVSGDRGISKTITKFGDGNKPVTGCTLQVRVRGQLEDGTVFDDRWAEPFTFDLGHASHNEDAHAVRRSLDLLFVTMRPTEEAAVVMEPGYAFGPDGHGDVPPQSVVYYTVALDSFTYNVPEDLSTSAASLDPLKRVERAGEIKTIGNDFFKQGNMEAALTCYSDCLTLLAEDFRFAPEIKAQSRALKIPICLNIAACQLRQRKFRDVVGICTELLQQDATLVKAYFRRAKAHQALGDFDDALQDYEAALHNSDESSEGLRASFVSAIERVKQAKADQDKQDKKVYERMFKETK